MPNPIIDGVTIGSTTYDLKDPNLTDEVSDLKSAIDNSYIIDRMDNGQKEYASNIFVHGGVQNASNFPLVLTNVTTRVRLPYFVKVNKGDRLIIIPGSYRYAVYAWTGNPDNGTNVLNRNWSTTGYERVITTETFCMVVFADGADTSATINLANFNGSVQIIPYEKAEIETFKESFDNQIESINSFDGAQFGGWLQGAAYQQTGGTKIIMNNVLTRCRLLSVEKTPWVKKIYSKDGYQFNVFACTISDGDYYVVKGWNATWQTAVDVSDYSEDYYLVLYVSKTNTSANITPDEAMTNILYVSSFSEKIENAINEGAKVKDLSGLFSPLLRPASPRIAMHRGFMGQAPENTVPAFLLAGQAGAWAIETDVWETTDGYFILNHNNDVSGMTDGTGNITNMTYAQVMACTVDSGVNINRYPNLKLATLDEYLQICRRYGSVAFIEIKGITHYGAFVDKIRQYGMEGSTVILILWNESTVLTVRNLTEAPIMILGSTDDFNGLVANAKTIEDAWIGISKDYITSANLANAHNENIPVGAWAYLTTAEIETAVGLGLDVVIANNNAVLT